MGRGKGKDREKGRGAGKERGRKLRLLNRGIYAPAIDCFSHVGAKSMQYVTNEAFMAISIKHFETTKARLGFAGHC